MPCAAAASERGLQLLQPALRVDGSHLGLGGAEGGVCHLELYRCFSGLELQRERPLPRGLELLRDRRLAHQLPTSVRTWELAVPFAADNGPRCVFSAFAATVS